MITSIGISIFGLIIGHRMFKHFDENEIFDSTTSKFFWIGYIMVHVLVFFVLQGKQLTLWIFEIISTSLPVMVYFYQDWTRKALFRAQSVPLLDILVLQMRSGRTLREALLNSSTNLVSIQFYVRELNSLLQFETESVVFSKDLFFARVANEILEIHRTPIKSIERIKAFRNRIKIEQDFRQRARRATVQVQLQAIVLSSLYIGLIAYVFWCYSWIQIQKYVYASLFLFVTGLFALLIIPRRFRWKI